MSDRVCYIQRADRGARIVRARLLGERADESWHAPQAPGADAAEQAALDAAAWLRDRLAETRTPRRLDTVCLDVDGAACSWVRGRDADTALIRSAVEGAGPAPADEDGLDPAQTPGIADRLPRLPLEVSYDLLGSPAPEARAAVLAAPDAPARLLLDRLDALGVRVERVVTFWHALAEAWDPGARPAANDRPGVITAEHPPAAVVAIDHDAARLVWAWSQGGRLLACGSARLRRARPAIDARPGELPEAEIHEHDVARLAGDWLGWSAQTGVCPTRVVVVGTPGPGGLTPGEVGAGLTRAWPGALTDLVGCEDAVAETLRRTLDARHVNAFTPLTERPTRAHRSAFRWSALALLVAAACIAVLAGLLFVRAGQARDLIARQRAARTELLNRVDPSLVLDPFPLATIEAQIGTLERRTGAVAEENRRPILNELETISLVLAMPGVTLDEIEVNDALVAVKTRVKDIVVAEQLDQALRRVGGSQLQWRPRSIRSIRDQIEAVYTAEWQRARSTP